MKFTLEIELGNDEMQTRADLRFALRETLNRLTPHTMSSHPKAGDGEKIRDVNGNTVGKWEVTED